ncbi:NAD(P)H nitroreductase [Mycobacterium mantenii]|uniref:NAD(P)H nitroreductase n=1 Tax=Mycobacterium mantenii TaxID=560555 RepID=A0A1X0G520_MYCNT|nr:nitroreductase family protein [Mycobacterium mantenii]MCV7242190.1 nitroreductase family protein [Mycobacterium mantenii]ORB09141.1 NAD(P)H nitroreductase [Mycobacterium mantenii]BBY37316.1 NAD(P)H nitroreductase [Mycobacterium mantenii]
MTTRFPDEGTVRTVLALASRAPSVHNTQPWRWLVGRESLHLYSELDRQLPNTDPDGRDLILSCGAVLNHCTVAFAAVGWQAKVTRLPNPDDPSHLAAIELVRATADSVDIALAAAIPRRRTDRRHYSSWPVPVGDIALMAARAARNGVTLCQVEDTDRLHKLVTQSVWDHMNHDYLVELTAWSGRYASEAGVPARNTPQSDPSARIPGRLFAGPALAMPSGSSAAEDNAVVLALGTRSDDRLAQLRAGEVTSIVLLTATSMGLASCPVTEPLEVAETREAVRAEIFGGSSHPQMLLRIGWAPINADPLPSTPRRDFSDVVEWMSDRERSGR